MIALMVQAVLSRPSLVKAIPYSEFQQLAAAGKLTNLVVGANEITGTFTQPADKTVPNFVTYRVDPTIAETLAKDKLTFTGKAGEGMFGTVLAWLRP